MNELAQPILSMPIFLIIGFISLMMIGLLAEHIERIQDKKAQKSLQDVGAPYKHNKNTQINYSEKVS
ncbi:hypothetical protein [Pseudogracilibacillus sp. SO10305]|uniref:hypothetical protein n=1 Tax=Pseudogracilibacillus sp. SO10305 TaxID=3098292 RepID=UPI00300E3262